MDWAVSNVPSVYFMMIELPKSGIPSEDAGPISATLVLDAFTISPLTCPPCCQFTIIWKLDGAWVSCNAALAREVEPITAVSFPLRYCEPSANLLKVRTEVAEGLAFKFNDISTTNGDPTDGTQLPVTANVPCLVLVQDPLIEPEKLSVEDTYVAEPESVPG